MVSDAKSISIRLTMYQAKILWGIVDGAVDAGACEGGLDQRESDALNSVTEKLLAHHSKWRSAK